MITARRLFVSSAVFAVAIAVAYWFSSYHYGGTILLGFMAAAMILAAGYMFFALRDARLIGDRGNATNAEGEGERLGTFTVSTPWPIVCAFGAFLLLTGLAVFPFMSIGGAAVLLFGIFGLVRESG